MSRKKKISHRDVVCRCHVGNFFYFYFQSTVVLQLYTTDPLKLTVGKVLYKENRKVFSVVKIQPDLTFLRAFPASPRDAVLLTS